MGIQIYLLRNCQLGMELLKRTNRGLFSVNVNAHSRIRQKVVFLFITYSYSNSIFVINHPGRKMLVTGLE